MELIRVNPKLFIEDLRAAILTQPNLVKDFNGSSLGSMLGPVYQIADGMQKMAPNWDEIRTDHVSFSDKVQGSIDREKIVSSFQFKSRDPIVKEKGEWLKDWIKNEASDDELKAFLKFTTGIASLPEGSKLVINQQAQGQPFLTACTCEIGIMLSRQTSYNGWNNTKELFTRNLKQAIAVEGFQRG